MRFHLPAQFIEDTPTRDNLKAIERRLNDPVTDVILRSGKTRCTLRFDGTKLTADVGGVVKVLADWSV